MLYSHTWYTALTVILVGCTFMVWSQKRPTSRQHLTKRPTQHRGTTKKPSEWKSKVSERDIRRHNKTQKFLAALLEKYDNYKKLNYRVVTISAYKAKYYKRESTTQRLKLTMKLEGFSSNEIMKYTCTPTKRHRGIRVYRPRPITPIWIPVKTIPNFVAW